MSILEIAIGLVAPPSCINCGIEGGALCQNCLKTQITPYGERCFDCGAISAAARTCEKCRTSAPSYVWVCTNYEATAQELVKIYKFGQQRVAAKSLAATMAQTFHQFNQSGGLDYLVMPVPTATSRIRQRGFDHSEYLARQIAGRLRLKHLNGVARTGQTSQVGAERSVRLVQLGGQYRVRYPALVTGRNILLIDDVVTTGATLRAATKALRAANAARVDALVFAKRL